jgi:hypothetical protein
MERVRHVELLIGHICYISCLYLSIVFPFYNQDAAYGFIQACDCMIIFCKY